MTWIWNAALKSAAKVSFYLHTHPPSPLFTLSSYLIVISSKKISKKFEAISSSYGDVEKNMLKAETTDVDYFPGRSNMARPIS